MTYQRPSRLADQDLRLVLSASTLINLLGTSHAQALIQALGRRCIIDRMACREIVLHPVTRKPALAALEALMREGLIEQTEMEIEAIPFFLDLALGQLSDGLDDGEAATLAQAVVLGTTAVLDDDKAIRIAAEKLPQVKVISTFDLLSSAAIAEQLGHQTLVDAVDSALRHARMRVPAEFRDWVGQLIGRERASWAPSSQRP